MDFREANQCFLCWNSHKEKTILFKPSSKMYTFIPFKQDVYILHPLCRKKPFNFCTHKPIVSQIQKIGGSENTKKQRCERRPRIRQNTACGVVVVVVLATFN